MESHIAAGIVLYNPDIKRLELNIDSIISQVGMVYLFDNGSRNRDDIDNLLKKYLNMNVVFIDVKDNMGIAHALNVLIERADADGYEWILTLDQDSISAENMIHNMSRYTSNGNVGIVCPVYYDARRKNIVPISPKNEYREVEFCITSGALTNISICKRVGGFDSYLFIGLVDNEYSYRLVINGYKIVQDCSVVLDHELGNITPAKLQKFYLKLGEMMRSEVIKKLSFKREVSSVRLYYTTRNMIYLNKKYPQNSVSDWSTKTLIKNSIFSIMRGDNKYELIKAIIRGVREARNFN